MIAVDGRVLDIFRERLAETERVAAAVGCEVVEDPFVFTVAADGGEPWDPDTVTQYFARLRDRLDLGHVELKELRRFMDTYGQELGFSLAQVSIRSGHDPAVASKHYTGRVAQSDRDLAAALSELIGSDSDPVAGDDSGIPPGSEQDLPPETT